MQPQPGSVSGALTVGVPRGMLDQPASPGSKHPMRFRRHSRRPPSVAEPANDREVARLVRALGDQDDRVYGAAVSALVSIGETAVPSLSRAVVNKREPWLLRTPLWRWVE
jgi:hypothetical protein